jgi:hypothetical protein
MVAKAHRVSEVARVAGITVRTLPHYDAIGLLTPSRSSGSVANSSIAPNKPRR